MIFVKRRTKLSKKNKSFREEKRLKAGDPSSKEERVR